MTRTAGYVVVALLLWRVGVALTDLGREALRLDPGLHLRLLSLGSELRIRRHLGPRYAWYRLLRDHTPREAAVAVRARLSDLRIEELAEISGLLFPRWVFHYPPGVTVDPAVIRHDPLYVLDLVPGSGGPRSFERGLVLVQRSPHGALWRRPDRGR